MAQLDIAARLRGELDQLRRITSTEDLLAATPAVACRVFGFDRAMVSRVDGSMCAPMGVHIAGRFAASSDVAADRNDVLDPGGDATPAFRLTSEMPETEVVRRRLPVLVPRTKHGQQLTGPLDGCWATADYVAAPIVASDAVFGIIHAARPHRSLGVVDRDRLQRLADGVGQLVERLAMLDRLAAQRERVNQAITQLSVLAGGCDAEPVWRVRKAAAEVHRRHVPAGLTPREHDVLELLAGGGTNAEIASRLTVSEATVKSHVKNILRKFDVSSRAGAIAKYLETREMNGGRR